MMFLRKLGPDNPIPPEEAGAMLLLYLFGWMILKLVANYWNVAVPR